MSESTDSVLEMEFEPQVCPYWRVAAPECDVKA